MDYDLICDRDGVCSIELHGELMALERWINAAERQSLVNLDTLIAIIDDLQQGRRREYQSHDAEFQITLTSSDCVITANWLLSDTEISDSTYDRVSLEEQQLSADEDSAKAECGLDDFAELLIAWRNFLQEAST